ncbi:ribonuclease Z [Marinicrinis lubricantis]|uniref:Ribonuclease Z n=1 Tax=Marinicrinis lubricantis TaxID=2086470 RepID=A0ABW1ITJ2_9BACL
MELYFLGTGAGMPARERNVTSICLKLYEERGTMWMFDCGEGTQHQVLRSPLKLSRLEKIFITHLHGDHIYGLPGLLTSRSYQGGDTPLEIYGPPGVKKYIETVLSLSEAHLDYDLIISELDRELVFEDHQFRVTMAKLEHRIDSYGYRIEEKERPGKLLHEKLSEAGVPPGPLYAAIKSGNDVTLEDGTRIEAAEYTSPPIPGRTVVIMGDTRITEGSARFCSGADVVVHEATFAGDLDDLAHKYYHTTAKQAARMAMQQGVGVLILTHISSRYQKEGTEQLEQEAKSEFENSFIARDFWEYAIPRIIQKQ